MTIFAAMLLSIMPPLFDAPPVLPPQGTAFAVPPIANALPALPAAPGELIFYVTPLPLQIVRDRILNKNPKFGMWHGYVMQKGGTTAVDITREEFILAVAAYCRDTNCEAPLILTAEEAGPIIARAAGAKAKNWKRALIYVAAGATALSGVPAVVVFVPFIDLATQGLEQRIPNITTLQLELPEIIRVPPNGSSKTLTFWTGLMAHPRPIGPFSPRP